MTKQIKQKKNLTQYSFMKFSLVGKQIYAKKNITIKSI